MSKKRIKPDATDISERKQIINSFCVPVQHISVEKNDEDIADHRRQIEQVYGQMLHDKSVIDDCCRRFEKTFRETGGDFTLYRIE